MKRLVYSDILTFFTIIGLYNKEIVACMAVTDCDKKYWSEILEGESLYVHKLAVKRSYGEMGISRTAD